MPFFLCLCAVSAGNLPLRFREIFRRNENFIGMRLPEPRELEPIERRLPLLSHQFKDIVKVCVFVCVRVCVCVCVCVCVRAQWGKLRVCNLKFSKRLQISRVKQVLFYGALWKLH